MNKFFLIIIFILGSCASPIGGVKNIEDIKPQEKPSLESIEAGLWMQMNNYEERLKTSGSRFKDKNLEKYLKDILCKLTAEYCKDIKSKIADIKNLGRGRLAGTISAGAFLKEFVGDTPWVHMDIAGTAWGPKEPSYMPKHGATGVAVRLIYNLIENREV